MATCAPDPSPALAGVLSDPAVVALRDALPRGVEAWLVGGTVRDALRGRPPYDLDVTTSAGAADVARRAADRLGGAYYLLDAERGSGRIVLLRDGRRVIVDVTDLRAPTLDEDLRERDFTVNAMAVPIVGAPLLVDPTDGRGDLARGVLRTPDPANVRRDPLRALRAVRLGRQLRLTLDPATRDAVVAAAPHLGEAAAERTREELLKILLLPVAAAALEDARALGLLAPILPELDRLPADRACWRVALATVEALGALVEANDGATPADPRLAAAAAAIAPWCEPLRERLATDLAVDHPAVALLVLAGLLSTLPASEGVAALAETVRRRLHALRLSRLEIDWVRLLVRAAQDPTPLGSTEPLSRRALHRFHRDAAPAGPELVLLFLARAHATGVADAEWESCVARAGELLGAFFDSFETIVEPAPLLRGEDLLAVGIPPGPAVGRALVAVLEAQAADEVRDRDGALTLAFRLASEPG